MHNMAKGLRIGGNFYETNTKPLNYVAAKTQWLTVKLLTAFLKHLLAVEPESNTNCRYFGQLLASVGIGCSGRASGTVTASVSEQRLQYRGRLPTEIVR